ncbi:MAG: hypothetical protein ACRECO_19680 [Xanthobacteraceae bacterium]
MSIFDIFRRRTVRDPASLAAFVDEQSLSLSERAVHDYLRGRAAEKADALFADATFRATLDKTRWEARPRSLAMVGEIVQGMLRLHAGSNTREMLHGLTAVILELFDRAAPPLAIAATDWQAAREELVRSLGDLGSHNLRSIEAITDSHAGYYLAIMPLHALLPGDDFPVLRNALHAMLAGVKEQFGKRADLRALAVLLPKHAPDAPADPR